MGILDEFMREKRTTQDSESSETKFNMSSHRGRYCHSKPPGPHSFAYPTSKPAVKSSVEIILAGHAGRSLPQAQKALATEQSQGAPKQRMPPLSCLRSHMP